MSMEKVRALTKEARTGFLATTDGRRAEVRCMGGWAWFGGELWMATAANSSKVADIQARAGVEICFMAADGRNVRIAGSCAVSRDSQDKHKLFESVPMLEKYMDGPDDPNYVVLRLTPQRVRLVDSPDLETIEVDPSS
jgi:general stress protein 26